MLTRHTGGAALILALAAVPAVALAFGRAVKKGELIGTVTDYGGREIERILSPVDGYVMYGLAGPPVRAGEAVVTIGIPARAPQ